MSVSIGGTYFETTVDTLMAGGPNSLLHAVVSSEMPSRPSPLGPKAPHLFFDRPPNGFPIILEYLRLLAQRTPDTSETSIAHTVAARWHPQLRPPSWHDLLEDARFFCLPVLEDALLRVARQRLLQGGWALSASLPLFAFGKPMVLCLTSYDGYILAGCSFGLISIFRVNDFKLITQFIAHTDIVTNLVVGDGTLASSSRDGSVCVWDLTLIINGRMTLSLRESCLEAEVWEAVATQTCPGIILTSDSLLSFTDGDDLYPGFKDAPYAVEIPHVAQARETPKELFQYVLGRQWVAAAKWRRQVLPSNATTSYPGGVAAVHVTLVGGLVVTGDVLGHLRVWDLVGHRGPAAGVKRPRDIPNPLPPYFSEISGLDDERTIDTQYLAAIRGPAYQQRSGPRAGFVEYDISSPAVAPPSPEHGGLALATGMDKLIAFLMQAPLWLGSDAYARLPKPLDLTPEECDGLRAERVIILNGESCHDHDEGLRDGSCFAVDLWLHITSGLLSASYYKSDRVAAKAFFQWSRFGMRSVASLGLAIRAVKAIPHRGDGSIIAAAHRAAVTLYSLKQAAIITVLPEAACGSPLREIALTRGGANRLLVAVGSWGGAAFIWVVEGFRAALMCEIRPPMQTSETVLWVSDLLIVDGHCLLSYSDGYVRSMDLVDVMQRYDASRPQTPSGLLKQLRELPSSTASSTSHLHSLMQRPPLCVAPSSHAYFTHVGVLRCMSVVDHLDGTATIVTGSFSGTIQAAESSPIHVE